MHVITTLRNTPVLYRTEIHSFVTIVLAFFQRVMSYLNLMAIY